MHIHSLEVRSVRKEYPGTIALDDVTLSFSGGSVHALLGKNGAGKSTLVKILTGAVSPTAGELLLRGRSVRFRTPADALKHGIAAVHQELSLVPGLTIAENIFLGRWPHGKGIRRPWVDWDTMAARAGAVLAQLGLALDVRTPAGSLSVAQQQLVEIARAMSFSPSVLLLDEPTSALARHETSLLFNVIRSLAASGVVILYITHRLQELPEIADTVTVLRDGSVVGSIPIDEASPARLASMMFGEDVARGTTPRMTKQDDVLLTVNGLSRPPHIRNVSFTLHRGEILGIAGVLGAGRTELLRTLFGAEPASSGTITIDGHTLRPRDPSHMKALGIALAPENRKEEGLVQILSTGKNICLASYDRIAPHGWTDAAREHRTALRYVRDLQITVPDVNASVASLSGGNQQKVVIGKWLNTEPRVLLLDEPTRGIDVHAKQQVFSLIRSMSSRGIASLVVSSELEELLEICHRILVLNNGALVAEFPAAGTRIEELLTACMQ